MILCPNAGSLEAKLFGDGGFPGNCHGTFSTMKRRRSDGYSSLTGFLIESISTGLGALYFMASLDRVWDSGGAGTVPCRRFVEKVCVRPLCFCIGHLGRGTELKISARKIRGVSVSYRKYDLTSLDQRFDVEGLMT